MPAKRFRDSEGQSFQTVGPLLFQAGLFQAGRPPPGTSAAGRSSNNMNFTGKTLRDANTQVKLQHLDGCTAGGNATRHDPSGPVVLLNSTRTVVSDVACAGHLAAI